MLRRRQPQLLYYRLSHYVCDEGQVRPGDVLQVREVSRRLRLLPHQAGPLHQVRAPLRASSRTDLHDRLLRTGASLLRSLSRRMLLRSVLPARPARLFFAIVRLLERIMLPLILDAVD